MTVIDVTDRPVQKLGPDLFRFAYPNGVASGEAVGTAKANAVVVATGVGSTGTVGTASTTASVTATGINAGSGAVGSPALTATAAASGVAGSGAVGTAATRSQVTLLGVASTAALGDTDAFTSMNPSGFNASGAGVGAQKTNAILSPTGIAGTEAFGDTDTLATVFIIPGPYDPTNDFGNATATKKGWVFRTPKNTYQWRLFKEYEGISLLKENGVWSEVAHPDLERTRAADTYLAGGRDHVVSTALKNELVALGYTVSEEFVTTEEYKS